MLCHVCLYRILLWIFDFMIIILYLFTSCLCICILFHQSPALILSYHEYFLLESFAVYLLAPACLCLRHGFHVYDSDLLIHVCLSILAIWLSHHHSPGSSDSSGSSCSCLGVWSVWILPVADQSGAAVAWISSRPSRAPSFQASCSALEFSCYDSEPPFVLFILAHLFVFSHLRHVGDVIFL